MELEAAGFADTHTSGGRGGRSPGCFCSGSLGQLGRRAAEPGCGWGGPRRRHAEAGLELTATGTLWSPQNQGRFF